jgi:site-specific DNA-adenine methylase
MRTATKLASPLMWVGGKHAQAARIVTAFPRADMYGTFVEVFGGNDLNDDLERAARWFYVLRSTFGGVPDFSKGWGYTIQRAGNNRARSLRTATALLALVVERFR